MTVRQEMNIADHLVVLSCVWRVAFSNFYFFFLTHTHTGEVYYASMLEELEREGRDFEADSWSLAVDASYLQTHRKDIIKRQDVIYGECLSGDKTTPASQKRRKVWACAFS